MLNHWDVEERVVLPHPAAPVTVLAPVGWLWSHPRYRRWAAWVRARGWRGWLPPWAVADCHSAYPDGLCPCGAYQLIWKEFRHAGQEDQD